MEPLCCSVRETHWSLFLNTTDGLGKEWGAGVGFFTKKKKKNTTGRNNSVIHSFSTIFCQKNVKKIFSGNILRTLDF